MFNYKVFVAELIGTFALVFIGAAIGMYDAGLLAVALAHGLTLAVFAYALGHISGTHINPAVTFGLALNGTVTWAEAVVYWVAQFVGAVLAAAVLNGAVGTINPQIFNAAQTVGALTERAPFYAVLIEALLTFFLVTVILHTAVSGAGGPLAGWAIGTTLSVCILGGGLLTGASLNPARTFGPAVVAGTAGNANIYLIYFLGPLLGAAIAVGVYRLLVTPENLPDEEPIPDVEDAPVEDVVEPDLDDGR